MMSGSIRTGLALVVVGGVGLTAMGQTRPASQPATTLLLAWETDYAAGVAVGRRNNQPILVRAGAVWCGWCKELDKEVAKPAVQDELRRWARIYVDVDRLPKEARPLAIGPVPALRALSPSGRLVASHDGYLEADDLIQWLKDNYSSAGGSGVMTVGSRTETTGETLERLMKDLDRRDPAVREAAIRRLILVPKRSIGPMVEALAGGGLATRLGALEVLSEWGAPVDGMDPWQPETLAVDRLDALRKWAARPDQIATSRPAELTAGQLAMVRREIAKLLSEEVSTAEVDAIRERMARHGQLLLPEVYEALKTATTDRARERLTGLRYRLMATDELAFSWPGGLERLAALDVETRHRAAEELVRRATAADEPLLLELFSDPDSMVREISLRALRKIGGSQASGALARLLKDPEPNVRAAVLKQLAESPTPAMVPKIAEYVAGEKDPDLVVHAIRVLRATKGQASVECLMSLLTYASWQVRAEAAEAIGEILSQGQSITIKLKKDAYAALLKLLDDSDGFVVGVAVKSLRASDLGDAADALARAADRHPELAADVLGLLAENAQMRTKAIPHLRRFCAHANAAVRAVAIASLCKATPNGAEKELATTLKDTASRVRVAAANALFEIVQARRPRPDDEAFVHYQVESSSSTGLMGAIIRSFRGARDSSSTVVVVPEPAGPQPRTQPAEAASSAPAPAVSPDVTTAEASRDDKWLDKFRAGTDRPKWMDGLLPALEGMLDAEAAEERLAAAVALVPFGRDERALPVLLAVVRQRPELVGTAAGALPWLPWDERLELFRTLTALNAGPGTLRQIADRMAVWPDPRAAQPLWGQFADKYMTPETAARLLDSLRRVYFGNYTYNASSAPLGRRRRAIADAGRRAIEGPELQRVAALALLLGASLKDAGETAAEIASDARHSEALRRDAFQVQLLSATRTESQKLAAAALTGTDPALARMALQYLAEGGESLRTLRGGAFYLYFQNPAFERMTVAQTGQPIKVTAPTGLTVEQLGPLLDNADARTAAEAAYLLATLKEPAGLDRLVAYWRQQARNDSAIKRLVYRAVAALDDDSQAPLLEEIYRTFPKGDYGLREFYWTIRDMSGPNLINLRKQIRDEVGMDNLQ
ncbi:MAG: HEAT repeat domain-containing protein [Planctomycetes bacterium]|nr:HEAT repeat domain-containing protein [Planctomycetota bacterium]